MESLPSDGRGSRRTLSVRGGEGGFALEQALEMIDRCEKPPEHMANCLYLEWFSEANGRVVIESTDYEPQGTLTRTR